MLKGYCQKCDKMLDPEEIDHYGFGNEYHPPICMALFDTRNTRDFCSSGMNNCIQLCFRCRNEITRMLANYFGFNYSGIPVPKEESKSNKKGKKKYAKNLL